MSGTLLVFCQVYPPDTASVGQHVADMAAELARRGNRVVVVTADRGYDDPSLRYPRHEVRDGVAVRRVPFSSFGKDSLAARALAMACFVGWCVWYGLTTRGLKGIVVSTVPPICGTAAAIVNRLCGVPYVYWVMDLNPDQMVALGKLREDSLVARLFRGLQRFALRHATRVVALDRFMAARINRIHDVAGKMDVFPPWPHGEGGPVAAAEDNAFRQRHGLSGNFVVMYSGNHGFSTPVAALLDAAAMLADLPRVRFVFVGGGVRKKEVDAFVAAHPGGNVVSLPYQPLGALPVSLSAADLHIVTMQAEVVGIVHPCKIYGAMEVARPVLLVGAEPSHAGDILAEGTIGWRADPDSPADIAAAIRKAASMPAAALRDMGKDGRAIIAARYSRSILCRRFADIVEAAAAPRP